MKKQNVDKDYETVSKIIQESEAGFHVSVVKGETGVITAIQGSTAHLLTLYSMLTNAMFDLKGADEKMVKTAFQIGLKTHKKGLKAFQQE